MEQITINHTPIQIKEYNGQRVVTFKDIDTVHQRPTGTAKRNFSVNKKHFIEGEDYFKICVDEIRTNKIMDISAKARADIMVVTESGYLMIVKSFTDDLAWNVQRQLVNSYFKLKELTTSAQETANAVMLTPQDLQSAVEVIHDCASVFQSMIDYATINYQQQNELLQVAKDRVNYLLGGAHSVKYKKHSRTYFKNLWIQFCQAFHCDSYKNLNPLYMADNVAKNWIINWVYTK